MPNLFDGDRPSLPPAVEALLRQTNPWWKGQPLPKLPPYHRWAFETALQRLKNGLAPVTVIRGPRQVGKTTLQQQIIEHLLQRENVAPQRILQVQFDDIQSLKQQTPKVRVLKDEEDPVLSICRWFEDRILQKTFNTVARAGEPAYLFFDEVQNLNAWAPQLKSLVDHNTVRVLVTGSSALRLEMGRDSLAGRISTLNLGPLLLREIAGLRFQEKLDAFLPPNGLEPLLRQEFWSDLKSFGVKHRALRDRAFAAFSERGGYPLAQLRADRPWTEVADQLNETVVQRVIQHDLRLSLTGRGRRRNPELLAEVFRLACRYAGDAAGQSLFVPAVQSALGKGVNWQLILAHLNLLDRTLLLRLIPPTELRRRHKEANPNKICLCDHALRAAWLQEEIPLAPAALDQAPHLSDLAGHIAESVAGYYLSGISGLDLNWFPVRGIEPEVDFILTVGDKRIPLEIKYRRVVDGFRDTQGLRSFIEKTVYNAPFGLLVTLHDDVEVRDPRIVALPLSSLLLLL